MTRSIAWFDALISEADAYKRANRRAVLTAPLGDWRREMVGEMKATHAYVGFNSAGEARAIVYDDFGYESQTAEIVAGWIRDGRTVQRYPIQEARELFFGSTADVSPTAHQENNDDRT